MCMLKARVRLPRRDKKGQGCKQEGVSSKRAMFSRLGGLSFLSGFLSLSLSLSHSFSRTMYQGCFFLVPRLGRVPMVWHMSVLRFLYLVGPYP